MSKQQTQDANQLSTTLTHDSHKQSHSHTHSDCSPSSIQARGVKSGVSSSSLISRSSANDCEPTTHKLDSPHHDTEHDDDDGDDEYANTASTHESTTRRASTVTALKCKLSKKSKHSSSSSTKASLSSFVTDIRPLVAGKRRRKKAVNTIGMCSHKHMHIYICDVIANVDV